jgi:O-antigen/teichoic acid export membrane protein
MSSIANKLIRGSGLRIIQTLVSIAIGFWMLPFLFQNLGSEQYGVWVLIGSTVGAFYMLDLGFSQAITRYVTKYIHTGDFEAANRIINTALLIYSLLGIVILVAAVLISGLFFDDISSSTLSSSSAAHTAFLILALSLALEFPAKAFPGVINAYLRFDRVAQTRTVFSVVNAILIYTYVSSGAGIVAIATITLCTNFLSTLFYVYNSKLLFKQLRFSSSLINRKDFTEIYHFSKWVFIIDAAFLLKDKLGIWLIAFFGMTPLLPIYYAVQRLTEYAGQFINQALAMSTPVLTKFHTENNDEKLRLTHSLFFKLYTAASCLFLSGFLISGKAFFTLWMGHEFDAELAFNILYFLCSGTFLLLICQPYISLLMATNSHRPAAFVALAELMSAIVFALYLVPEYGLIGVAISCSLVMGVIRIIWIPAITAQKFGKKLILPILRAIPFAGIIIFLSFLLSTNLAHQTTWFSTIATSAFSLPLTIVPAYFLFTPTERMFISTMIKERFIKSSNESSN